MAETEIEINELQRLKFIIDYLGLENYFVAKSERTSDDTILIAFPETVPGEQRVSLQLTLINPPKPGEENTDKQTMLQFYYDPKITAREENLVEIIDLIAKFNNLLPFGSFGFSDEKEVFFRYIYPYSEGQIFAPFLSELLDMLNYYLHKTGLNIKAFSKGEKSFDLALQDGIELRTKLDAM